MKMPFYWRSLFDFGRSDQKEVLILETLLLADRKENGKN